MIHPVILCGGSGTRLWPASRKAYPKQFAPLLGQDSLFQMTLRRFADPRFSAPLVLTGDAFRFLATDQAQATGLADPRIVVEPEGRDTAAAVLAAAMILVEEDADAVMLVAPSDHVIADAKAFLAAVDVAADAALGGALVTFGVTPNRPETGYGYLELPDAADGTKGAARLKSFREKPDLATAQEFLSAGRYLWNAGIFMFRAADVIAAFEAHAPDLLDPCRTAISQGARDLGFFRLGADAWKSIRPISFDYAIMERAVDVMAVPLDCGWSDLGSWDAIWHMTGPNSQGVATAGSVTVVDCTNSYLRSESEELRLVGLGLEGIVAVAMPDAVLVAAKDRAQDLKSVVAALRTEGATQADDYPRFHRPWGWYETLCLGTRFQVKRIMVKPGGILSLQSHHHRSEHWVVVEGTAEVTIGDEVRLVTENESIYIPLGSKHRMANPGKLPMYLIEVQTGSYLGEDDIVRYEDVYNRPERE